MLIILICVIIYIFYRTITYTIPKKLIRHYSTCFNVPRTIYRTHNNLNVNWGMYYYCHQKWLELNPDHSMIWFNNSDCTKFMASLGQRIYTAYQTIKPGAYKADLFRACILYHHGGVYIDSYTTPFHSLAFILQDCWNPYSSHQFISIKDREKWGIHNGFIISTPKHPFLKQYIEDMLANIEYRFYGRTDLDITGPRCLLKSINTVLKQSRDSYSTEWNKYGELSFYLLELRNGMYTPVYKNKELVMNKKYSFLHYINQKVFQHSTTYASMWKNKAVYNQTTENT